MDKVGDEFVPTEGQPKMKEKRSMSMKQQGVRVVRCAGRNDRHSKVCTARGIRDRRVRLSPKTAILFYDVQDRLGCDRPSKAIDWLIKEAKAAIDALDHPPAPPPPPNYTNAAASPEYHHHMFKFECSNDHNILPISGFGFPFNGGAPPPFVTPELQALAARSESEAGEEYYQQQFLSAPTPLGLFDANSEIVRLQRILSWNYANADFHYPAPADFHEREPLQSSYSRINSNYPQLIQGFGFPDQEMPNFKEDDINLRQPPS